MTLGGDLGAFNQPPDPRPLPTPPAFVPPPGGPLAAPQGSPPAGALSGVSGPAAPPPQGDDIDAFAARLMGPESGGRADVVNSGGYAGLFQFGAPRLAELGLYTPGPGEDLRNWSSGGGRQAGAAQWTGQFRIPGFENVRTLDDFRNSPDAQRAALRLHVQNIDEAIANTPGAEAFDRTGLRGVAHLGGNGGMARFVESGGRHDPADGNGTRLSGYYTRFSGTDAPNGLQGRIGASAPAGANVQQTSAPTTRPDALPADPTTRGFDPMTGSPSFMGVPGDALIAAGAGMLGGRNPAEGFSRAGQAFVGQVNKERDRGQQAALRRAQMRATEQSRQDNLSVRREALEISRARAAAAGSQSTQTRGQPQMMTDPTTGLSYTRVWMNDGTQRTLGPDNQPVADAAVLSRLQRAQDTGFGRTAGQVGVDNQEAAETMVTAGDTARRNIATIQNIRTGITAEGGMGPDVVSQVQRFLADRLRIPTGSVTPQGLALNRQQIDSFVATVLPDLVKELRPVSNIDAETVRRALISANTEQEAMRVILDTFEAPLRRQTRMADDWREMTPERRLAVVRGGPQAVSSWQAERRRVYDDEGFYPPVRTEPRAGGGFQAMRPGQRRELPSGITIERVN